MTDPPLLWTYALASGVQGSFATAGRGRCPALADVLILDGTPVFADARALIARSFADFPGLSVAAVGRVVGDRAGDVAIVGGALAGVAAHVWVLGGRRLGDLGGVALQAGPDPVPLRPADLLVQLQCLDEVAPRRREVAAVLRHVGEADQDVRLVDR